MKRFQGKGFVAGILTASILMFSFGGYAESISQTVNAIIDGTKVTLNGKEIKSDTEPLIYAGRTYLPVRAIAEALGVTVNWNDATKTAEITTNVVPTSTTTPTIKPTPKATSTPTPVPQKTFTLYSEDGRMIENVPEDKIASYGTGWYTEKPPQKERTVFRNVTWGMTKDEVKNSESVTTIMDLEKGLAINNVKISTLNGSIYYLFNDEGKLYRIGFYSDEKHSNNNDYIADYKVLKGALTEKYGSPKYSEDTVWKNDLFKNDYENWGLAIASGQLVYGNSWVNDDSNIELILDGDNYKITLNFILYSKTVAAPTQSSGL